MAKIILKPHAGKRIKNGHKWVFSNEIERIDGRLSPDKIVYLYDDAKNFIGLGFYNPHSLISFRLITRKEEYIDANFWEREIFYAKDLRNNFYPKDKSYRAVFSESDNMPGVIVDKYENYLCVQFLCAGADACKQDILKAVSNVFNPKGIFIRNDSNIRKLENLPLVNEFFFGTVPEIVEIYENEINFYVSLIQGQKTGFFFDQKDNRQKFSKYVKDKNILDCYCYTGAFGIYSKVSGARKVIFVDSSRLALETAEKNYELNKLENFQGIEADALEYIQSPEAKSENFDLINIDPPGIIKNKKDFNAGFKHYVKINSAAMSLLKSGGILATSSCSHHLSFTDFKEMIKQSAIKAKKKACIVEYGFQAKDHPILSAMPETEYLKFAVVVVSAL